MKPRAPSYIRKGRKYLPAEVLPFIKTFNYSRAKRVPIDGDLINISSARLNTFRNGLSCVCCGLEGSFFVKEKHRIKPAPFFTLNLYAIDEFGREVQMTSDHIVPRAWVKGLENNRQTMCSRCNHTKGARDISFSELREEVQEKYMFELNSNLLEEIDV